MFHRADFLAKKEENRFPSGSLLFVLAKSTGYPFPFGVRLCGMIDNMCLGIVMNNMCHRIMMNNVCDSRNSFLFSWYDY